MWGFTPGLAGSSHIRGDLRPIRRSSSYVGVSRFKLLLPYVPLENVNSTVSNVSFPAGSYFQSFTVSTTDFTSTGLPPITFVPVTAPSADTVTCSFTFPSTCSCCASFGYGGSDLVLIGRFDTSITTETLCAHTIAGA